MTSHRRALARGLVCVTLALAAFALDAAPASAHSELVSSDPADGAELADPPRQVVLTFNEEIQQTGTAVTVTGPSGTRVDDEQALRVIGSDVVAPMTPDGAGGYRVAYRAVSADGHVISGTLQFTVALPVSPSPPTTPETTSSPTPIQTTTGDVTPAAEAERADGGGSSSLPWLVLVAVVALSAAVLAVVLRRARRGRA